MEAELRRSLPQLNALRSFEAAARHQSFTRAADELCVTQGAVSHQVKALEAELGLKLFNRERQGLAITDAGHDYLAVVRDAFDRIALGFVFLLHASRMVPLHGPSHLDALFQESEKVSRDLTINNLLLNVVLHD